MFSKQDDILTAAEKYMEEHGTGDFQRLITKVNTYIYKLTIALGTNH